MNSRSARPPGPRFRSCRGRDASSLRRIDDHLGGHLRRIHRRRSATSESASVTSWPKPPVAKITRARVSVIRSQTCVDR